MTKILLDTDIGNDMDDMQALAYLLSRSDTEILGITTVTGEPVVRAQLADLMCRLVHRDVSIHVGAAVGLSGAFRQNAVSPKEKVLTDQFPHRADYAADAVEFLRSVIRSHPGEITLCCIGPLTNIAMLFESDPEIPALLKDVILMGGRFGDVDTARWGAQEWNIVNDIRAAQIVFSAPLRSVRIFGVEQTSRVFRTDTGRVADEAAQCSCLVPFSRAIRTSKEAWYHDAVALAALFDDSEMTFARGTVHVTDAGDTVFVPNPDGCHKLLTGMDIGSFFRHFYETVGIAK